jgi:hypothetical protein
LTLTTLPIASIRIDGGTQPRAAIDIAVVEDYAVQMADGKPFPPIIVFHDGAEWWLADGFHRYHARSSVLGEAEIEADVRPGTRRDAVLYSVGANTEHGLRRTNEDKRRAVLTLLGDEEWGQWSDREIARRCGVSDPFVGNLRQRSPLTVRSDEERTYTTKHGTQASMRVQNLRRVLQVEDEAPAAMPMEPAEHRYCHACGQRLP